MTSVSVLQSVSGNRRETWCNAMSWDLKKRGGKYLYLSRRINGRTVKEYVGRGPMAEVIARQVEEDRQQKRATRARRRGEKASCRSFALHLRGAGILADLLVGAGLIFGGYHRHQGEWRRRREGAQG